MILICDSGSTKTDWVLVFKDKQKRYYKTAGFNPYYVPKGEMIDILEKELVPHIDNFGVKYLFYYGSGCSTKNKRFIIEEALEEVFTHAIIEVQHDLLGAARGLLNNKSGIACILGTGSNSCLYNGTDIEENISSLGYLFGDEGGGAHIGKVFLTAFLKNELPDTISKAFKRKFDTSLETILDSVYNQPRPNRYLASFMEFIGKHKKDPFIYTIIFNSFDAFFKEYLIKYSNYKNHKIGYVGSVAYYFKDILEEVVAKYDTKIYKISKDPIKGLIEYHEPDINRYIDTDDQVYEA